MIGDAFYRLMPSRPANGEVIDLGVGILDYESYDWDTRLTGIVLRPSDGRLKFWLDVRKLYRLHDQTVELLIEETANDFTEPYCPPQFVTEDNAISNGDGTLQTKIETRGSFSKLEPNIVSHGDGLFSMTTPGYDKPGTVHKLR